MILLSGAYIYETIVWGEYETSQEGWVDELRWNSATSNTAYIGGSSAKEAVLKVKKTLINSAFSKLGMENGKSNAIRLNNNGNGILTYYWGGTTENYDVDTGDIGLTDGTHTVSVINSGTKTLIYLDGELKKEITERKKSNVEIREITVGATKMLTKATYYDSTANTIPVQITGTESWTYLNGLESNYRTELGETARIDIYGAYAGKEEHFDLNFEYEEFFNDEIYSVRVYNKALNEDEIGKNFAKDKYRFGF